MTDWQGMEWKQGQQLKNRPYPMESILGVGGFGITYKAKHVDLDFTVVLKTPNARLRRGAQL